METGSTEKKSGLGFIIATMLSIAIMVGVVLLIVYTINTINTVIKHEVRLVSIEKKAEVMQKSAFDNLLITRSSQDSLKEVVRYIDTRVNKIEQSISSRQDKVDSLNQVKEKAKKHKGKK